MPEPETVKAMQVLDLLLEFFGEDGAHWTSDRYHDGNGRRCLVGALYHLRRKHRIPSGGAEYFLQEALPHRRGGLVYFNDRCRSFAELRSVIVRARILALQNAERERAAAAVERWLLTELERERAARAAAGDERPTSILCPRTSQELTPKTDETPLSRAA
jgi:hypothetical protein